MTISIPEPHSHTSKKRYTIYMSSDRIPNNYNLTTTISDNELSRTVRVLAEKIGSHEMQYYDLGTILFTDRALLGRFYEELFNQAMSAELEKNSDLITGLEQLENYLGQNAHMLFPQDLILIASRVLTDRTIPNWMASRVTHLDTFSVGQI
jgi:hypothetical protein